MKIHFIGTSHGAAEKGRRCTSTLLETNDCLYAIDCGTAIGEYLKNVDLSINNFKALFVTHMHADHCGALSNLVKLFTVYNRDKNRCVALPEESAVEAYLGWHKALHMPNIEGHMHFIKSTEGLFFEDENIKVSGIKTDHIHGFDTYSYIIEVEGKRVLFTGDLSADAHDFPEIAHSEHFDAVISELTHFGGNSKMAEVLMKTKTDHMIFNHIYPGNDKWIEGYRNEFSCPMTIAKDNDIIEI